MNQAERTELKLITRFLGYLDKDDAPIKRWRLTGQTMAFLGAALVSVCAFGFHSDTFSSLGVVLVSFCGGLLIGTGGLFTLSAQQWPLFSGFLNIEKLRIRQAELQPNLKR